jgi:dTDP-4-dehydrorhamnose reductase
VRVLVTGAGGLVGSALVGTGQVFGLDRTELDITDSAAVGRLLDSDKPTAIINAAAQASVDQADADPAWTGRVNGEAPGDLARMAAHRGVRFVHLSTDYVLDDPERDRLTEDLEPRPRSLYAESKLAGERAALEAGAVVIRLQWVYQPGSRGFFNRAMAAMSRGESVRLVTDQVGCPTPASLLAPALLQIAHSGPVGLFHLATQGEASAWEWMQAGALALGIPFIAEPSLRSDFSGAHRPARSVLDSTKTEQAWGIRLPNWRDALQTVVDEGDTIASGVES